jgi:hypothetical protein
MRTGPCFKTSESDYPVTQLRVPGEQNSQIKDSIKRSGMKLRFYTFEGYVYSELYLINHFVLRSRHCSSVFIKQIG